MSERRPEEITLVDELKELGRQLTATIQAVATSDDVRSLGRDLRDGLRAAAQHVEETVGEVRDHDEVQRLRVRAADVAGSFKTGAAQREIRTELEAALRSTTQKGRASMSTEDNKGLLHRLTECWNQGNVALLEELHAPDFIHHNPDRPDVRSREDYKRWFAESHSVFPDLHLTIEIVVAEGDNGATRWTFRGTNTGDFEFPAPAPATGKPVSYSCMNIFRFAGGKIVEEWFQEDTMGMVQQLGLMPAPEQ